MASTHFKNVHGARERPKARTQNSYALHRRRSASTSCVFQIYSDEPVAQLDGLDDESMNYHPEPPHLEVPVEGPEV